MAGRTARKPCKTRSGNKKWRTAGARVAVLQGHESVLRDVPKGQTSDTPINKQTLLMQIDAMLATTRCTMPQVRRTRCPAARPFAVLLLVGLFAAVFAQSLQAVAADPPIAKVQVPALLKHSLTRIDGQPLPLAKYRGKLLLVVNVASRCGYTSQYAALQKLHERFAARGLIVLGVPSNDFGAPEPLSNDEIAALCKKNYGVTFTLAAKTKVRGKDKHKFFAHLVAKETSPKLPGEIKWNFEKFLIDRDGLLVARYG